MRFRYIENPRCENVETSKDFCAELRKAGKTVVNVDFELWGHSHTATELSPLTVVQFKMLAAGGGARWTLCLHPRKH